MTHPILLLPEEQEDMQSPIGQHESQEAAQCRPSVQEAVGRCAQVPPVTWAAEIDELRAIRADASALEREWNR